METRQVGSRRVLYMIPATGEPTKLVYRIETAALEDRASFVGWCPQPSAVGPVPHQPGFRITFTPYGFW